MNIKEDFIFFFFVQIYYSICEMHYNGIINRNLKHLNKEAFAVHAQKKTGYKLDFTLLRIL